MFHPIKGAKSRDRAALCYLIRLKRDTALRHKCSEPTLTRSITGVN